MDKALRRHRRFWRTLRGPVGLFMRIKFRFKPAPAPELPAGGCLILSNHTTPWDPLMVGVGLKEHMYFVASEHIFRLGIVSWLLNRYLAPIARLKGSTDAAATAGMLRQMKNGNKVALFPEGNTSWSGQNPPMHPSVPRLARMCGVPVVTYRLVGGYLTHPRWGIGTRPGSMTGHVVNIYTPEQLKAMSKQEVADRLKQDLFEDAYATQAEKPMAYKGRRRAECLEAALYMCPKCGRIATLHSKGSRFWCDCGLDLQFNVYGEFEGTDVPFKNTLEWDKWQNAQMRTLAENLGDEPAFSDPDQSLWSQSGHEQTQVAAGTLSLYRDRLVLGEAVIPISEISQINMFGREHVVFTAGTTTYEIKSTFSRSGRKYMTMIEILKSLEVPAEV